MFDRNGSWNGEKLISADWIDRAVAPSEPNPDYGYMWWTLKGDTGWDGVSDHVYYSAGFGGNYIVVDQENDLVIVLRWIDGAVLGDFVSKVYQAVD